jgi:hypothetical protein
MVHQYTFSHITAIFNLLRIKISTSAMRQKTDMVYEGTVSKAFKQFWSVKKDGRDHQCNNNYNSSNIKPDWIEVECEDGRGIFFHNIITKEAVWEKPFDQDIKLLDGTILRCKKKTVNEEKTKMSNKKRNTTRFFLHLKGVKASIVIQSFVRGYFTRIKVLQNYGYERNAGSSLFEDHPAWHRSEVVQKELKAIGIGLKSKENKIKATRFVGGMHFQKDLFQCRNQPEVILGYQFGLTQNNKAGKTYRSNDALYYPLKHHIAPESRCSYNGNEDYNINNIRTSFDIKTLYHRQLKKEQLSPTIRNRMDSVSSSDNDIDDNLSMFETSKQKVYRHRYHNHNHTATNSDYNYINDTRAKPPVNISPVHLANKKHHLMSPIQQRRRLKKWTRGGKAINIIPDTGHINDTRNNNSIKRENSHKIRQRVKKDTRTESASSSDSYLSRYLASRNSTPGR